MHYLADFIRDKMITENTILKVMVLYVSIFVGFQTQIFTSHSYQHFGVVSLENIERLRRGLSNKSKIREI